MKKSRVIMIVDDDEDDVELFSDALKEVDREVQCTSASNGEDALIKLSKGDTPLPDYIFLDLNMPRLNGKQCLKRLKSDSKLRHIPVIIYTTSKLREDMEETKQLGAVHFLTKPNKLNDLRKEITSILNGKNSLSF